MEIKISDFMRWFNLATLIAGILFLEPYKSA